MEIINSFKTWIIQNYPKLLQNFYSNYNLQIELR
jgi:hypothetical protein